MKLFLTSMAISHSQRNKLLELVGKTNIEHVKIALIENAADVYDESDKQWMLDNRTAIKSHGFQVDIVDLEEYRVHKKEELLNRLSRADVIWLGGGNTYYLRWILRETKADEVITGLVLQGKVYGGGSAGAIVAGPSIDYFQAADNPSQAPEEIIQGLKLTKNIVVPHWGNQKYGPRMRSIYEKLMQNGQKVVCITDEQVVIINDDDKPEVI